MMVRLVRANSQNLATILDRYRLILNVLGIPCPPFHSEQFEAVTLLHCNIVTMYCQYVALCQHGR